MMKKRWLFALLFLSWSIVGVSNATAYDDYLPTTSMHHVGVYDGDPDVPTHFTAGGPTSIEEQRAGTRQGRPDGSDSWWTTFLLWITSTNL
jgi:hypothetical protein